MSPNMLLATCTFLVIAVSAKQTTDQMTLGVMESGAVVPVPQQATRNLVRKEQKTSAKAIDHVAIAGAAFTLEEETVSHNVSNVEQSQEKAQNLVEYCYARRRRSTYQHLACNSGTEGDAGEEDEVMMSGSRCFSSCNWPNMESFSGEDSGWFGACNCKSGFQQGDDDDHGSAGVCRPCGCLNLVSEEGFLVDVCPVTYPNTWLQNTVVFGEKVVLPTFKAMEEKIALIKSQTAEKITEIKASVVSASQDSIAAIKSFAGVSLLEIHRIHAEEFANFKYEEDDVWDSIKESFDHIKAALVAAAKSAAVALMETAKSAWQAAKETAARLQHAASAARAALPEMLRKLGALITEKMQALWTMATDMLKTAKKFLNDQWQTLKQMASGVFSIDNFNMQLSITNPTVIKAHLKNVSIDFDYCPVAGDGGGIHGGTDKINLGQVNVSHDIPFDSYGTTVIDVGAVLKHLDLDMADILDHGLMGFLEDAASGVFKLSVDVKDDLVISAWDVPLGPLAGLALKVLDRITIPIPLDNDFKEVCADACNAYNFLTLQSVTKIEHDSEAELNVTLNGEGCEPAKVVEAGVDEGDKFEEALESKELLYNQSARNVTKCSEDLDKAVEDAAKEVPDTDETSNIATIKDKLKTATDDLQKVAEETVVAAIKQGQELLATFKNAAEGFLSWFR